MSLLWTRVAAYDPKHPDNTMGDAHHEDEEHPTDYGFHCGGECWDKAGTKVHYNSPEYARANHPVSYGGIDWSEKPVERHPIPKKLHAIQDFVNPAVVDHYLAGGGPGSVRHGQQPAILKWQGKHFAFQGTHRLAAAMQRGDTHFEGKYHDLDAEMGR